MVYRRYLLIVAIATCLAIGMACAVYRPEAGGNGGAFSAMTFNVGDANPRPFPVARTAACILAEGRSDVLFLQEVPRAKTGAEFSAG
jgi:hypothetical protein